MSTSEKFENTLVDSSRLVADMVSDVVGQDPERFAALLELVYRGTGTVSDRAARAAFLITDKHPDLVVPHAGRLIQLALSTRRRSLRKNVMRMLTSYRFSGREKQLGKLVDKCYQWITEEYENPALQVYSIDILRELTRLEPDLGIELKAAIEAALPLGSKGFRNKGIKTIRELNPAGYR